MLVNHDIMQKKKKKIFLFLFAVFTFSVMSASKPVLLFKLVSQFEALFCKLCSYD